MHAAVVRPTRAYRIVHTTRYDFDRAIGGGKLELRLRPRDLPHQLCEFHQIVTRPLTRALQQTTDRFGNPVAHIELPGSLQSLEISAISQVRVTQQTVLPDSATPAWQQVRDSLAYGTADDRARTGSRPLAEPKLHQRLLDYASPSFRPDRTIMEAATDLRHRVHNDFRYDPCATDSTTDVAEVLRRQRGVCRDFARAMIAMLRALQLEARYVCGYVDHAAPQRRREIGSNASHAWCELRVPGSATGWVGLDPTYDCTAGQRHVTLAWGRDSQDVVPVAGCIDAAAGQRLQVSVDVERLTGAAGERGRA